MKQRSMYVKLLSERLAAPCALLALFTVTACSSGEKTGEQAQAQTCADLPPLAAKTSYNVGFAQISLEGGNPWRAEETRSMTAEAKARHYTMHYSEQDASGVQSQVANVQQLIEEKVDAIFIAPQDSTVLAPSVVAARKACIPVFLVDRDVNHDIAIPGQDYVSFLGSDFELQGKLVAQWVLKKLDGKAAAVIELEGTTGATPAVLRKKGFDDAADAGGMQILVSQTGDFQRATGKQVAADLIAAYPDANVIYAHNDEMALGAIDALKDAGKVPGKDMLVASIDGERNALESITAGELSVSVTSNPSFGPLAFDQLEAYAAGKEIPTWVVVEDKTYDAGNAAAGIPTSY